VDANNIKVDSNLISEILSEMTSYAQYHFAAEEKIMLKYGYPGYPVHKEQHIKFIEQTVDFCMKTINHEDDVPARLFEYLTTWLIDHVLYTDKKMKPFLRPKDIN
jgi:hemerythrin-like metal-binding protein